MVCICIPNLLSAAIATQFFPFIATTAPPLYENIDWKIEKLQIDNYYYNYLAYYKIGWIAPNDQTDFI